MQEPPSFYLQIEAVNLIPTVYDTSQLSVVRGGSLLLKWAVEMFDGNSPARRLIAGLNRQKDCLLAHFDLPEDKLLSSLTAISTGASSGVFLAQTQDPGTLAQAIADFLSVHAYLRFFTFTVVWTEDDKDFAKVKERLIGKTRRQQLRQLSLAPQPLQESERAAEPCVLEGVLPANSTMPLPPKNKQENKDKLFSPACQQRFLWGRFFRHGLYRAELQAMDEPPQKFTQELIDKLAERETELWRKDTQEGHEATRSFDEIAEGQQFVNLENKIAVFYADGNRFSSIQAKDLETAKNQGKDPVKAQQDFDTTVKGNRRKFLRSLLARWLPPNKGEKIPLETLLWGGDEMLFVVPASKGLELVQLFYAHSRDWKSPKGTPLTHAGGLVFCHYKTPIARAQKLARDLADSIKDRKYGREGNYFDYAVLESIDYPAEPLEDFLNKRYGPLAEHRFPLRPMEIPPGIKEDEEDEEDKLAEHLEAQAKCLSGLLESLPKSQAYLIAQAALLNALDAEKDKAEFDEQLSSKVCELKKGQARTAFLDTLRRFKQLQIQGEQNGLETLIRLLWRDVLRQPDGHTNLAVARWQWLHLVELWDYLARVPAKEETRP